MNVEPAEQECKSGLQQALKEPVSDPDPSTGVLARNLELIRDVLTAQFSYRRGGDEYRAPTASEQEIITSYVEMLSKIEFNSGVLKKGERIDLVDARIKAIDVNGEQLFALLKISDRHGNYQVRSSDLELNGHLLSTGSLPAMVEVYSDLDTVKRSVAALQDNAAPTDPDLVWQYRMIYSALALSHECRILSSDEVVRQVLSNNAETSSFVLYQTIRLAMHESGLQPADLDLANLNDEVSVTQVRLEPVTATEFRVRFPKHDKEVDIQVTLKSGTAEQADSNREQLGILYFNKVQNKDEAAQQ